MFNETKIVKITVQPGDTFIKVDGIGSIWEIERVLEYSDLPPHIRLVETGGNGRTATVALSSLMDVRMWKKVTLKS